MASEADDFDKEFNKWLAESVGISRELRNSLHADDDWTFVIKLHAMVEAALSHLILSRLNEPKLAKIISRLDTNDKRKGKIAFIKAYELLPDNALLFVRKLSDLRNIAIHGIKGFGLDIATYLRDAKEEERANWGIAIGSYAEKPLTKAQIELALQNPRLTLYACCLAIMIRSYHARPGAALRLYQSLLKKESAKHDESKPKK